MTYNAEGAPACDMTEGCTQPVTMLDDHGFIYCEPHGLQRRASCHRCRKLRPHELRQLGRHEQIKAY